MKPTLVAIDPGANGGVAYRDPDGVVLCFKMPDTIADLDDRLCTINPDIVIVEKVGGYMPGNSGPAACKFARHCGEIEGVLTGGRYPHESVSPQKWMKHLGSLPKDKTARKNEIKRQMQARYPNIKITLATSDALGILTWAVANGKGMS